MKEPLVIVGRRRPTQRPILFIFLISYIKGKIGFLCSKVETTIVAYIRDFCLLSYSFYFLALFDIAFIFNTKTFLSVATIQPV